MKIGTHSGPFHCDDVVAVAILRLAGHTGEVVRTRDPAVLAGCDIVVDVGGIHDAVGGRFDHHQKGGAGSRPNGVAFSSAGLVWSHFGATICGEEVAAIVDGALIAPVDALDNGQGSRELLPGVDHVTLSDVVSSLNPCWHEQGDFDGAFARAVEFAQMILGRAIESGRGEILAREGARAALAAALDEGKIVVLDRFMPVMNMVVDGSAEARFLVFPQAGDWLVQAVPVAGQPFSQRLPLPAAWAGLRGADLAALTGVADSVFCHNGRFIGGAGSREGAIALARLALAAG